MIKAGMRTDDGAVREIEGMDRRKRWSPRSGQETP